MIFQIADGFDVLGANAVAWLVDVHGLKFALMLGHPFLLGKGIASTFPRVLLYFVEVRGQFLGADFGNVWLVGHVGAGSSSSWRTMEMRERPFCSAAPERPALKKRRP